MLIPRISQIGALLPTRCGFKSSTPTMRKKTNFASLKSSLHRPADPRKSPQLEFVEVRNCHCCCCLLHLNPMAVYRLLLSWANAELSSKGVVAKRQNSTSFRSGETKNNKYTTRQPEPT